MNRFNCEREKEIVEVLRRGSLDAELEKHARDCPICSDAAAVSRFLLTEGLPMGAAASAPVLPDADFVWWKGQLVAKRMAVERATRSIALVRKISYLAVLVATLWFVFAPGHLESITNALSKYEEWATGGLRATALLMAICAVIFTVVGSLYLARAEES